MLQVWEFNIDVVAADAKRSFTANTSMTWVKFEEEVVTRLDDDTPKPIQIAYKSTGDTGKLTHLKNVVDWDDVLTHLCAKMKMAHKHAVQVEIKNVVSFM